MAAAASALVCNACLVRVADERSLKAHYRGEFHQHNLTRRTLDLPPVPFADFRAARADEATAKAAAAAAAAPVVFLCDACGGRSFGSEGQFEAHVASKKHAERVRELLARQAAAVSAAAAATALAPVAPPQPPPAKRRRAVARLGGAVESKEEVAPEDEEEEDEEEEGEGEGEGAASAAAGLGVGGDESEGEEEEEELVVSSKNCLFCFAAAEDVRSNLVHMQRVHSFFVPDVPALADPEGLLERLLTRVVAGHCLMCTPPDGSGRTFASAAAAQQHMVDKAHCRLRYDGPGDYDDVAPFYDYGGEDGGGGDDEEAGQLSLVLTKSGLEGVTATPAGDIRLPDGRVARHRALMKYYKQYYRPTEPAVASMVRAIAADYAAAIGAPPPSSALVARGVTAGFASGTRGNVTSPRDQRAADAYLRHMLLHTATQMNSIRRLRFRVAATGIGT